MNIAHTKILPYQNKWQEKFKTEKKKLDYVFEDIALEVEHIGSTSVVGLASKSIIDIAVVIEDHIKADSFTEPLAQLGYTLILPMGTERHFYTKGDPIEYHLSIAYANRGGFWPRQILFRDYLRTHDLVRDKYAGLKADLLQKDPTGENEYIKGKTEFIQKILILSGWEEGQKYEK